MHTHSWIKEASWFYLKALIWGVLTYLIAKRFATDHFWIVVVSVLLFSVPLSLGGMYSSTIRQIRFLTFFHQRGWIFRLLSSRPLKVIFWIIWSLAISFLIFVQFHTYGGMEWIVFFVTVPVFWGIFFLNRKMLSAELKPYLVTEMALQWARRLSPLIMLVIAVTIAVQFGEIRVYGSFQEAVAAQKTALQNMTGSALMWELSQYLAFYDGLKAYALGHLGSADELWALVLLGFGYLVVFYNTCTLLSSFLISRIEYRRLFGPLTDDDEPPSVPLSRIAAIAGGTTFIALFIYLPMFAYLEAWIQERPEVAVFRKNVEIKVEQIGEGFFLEGTLAEIHNARVEAMHKVELSLKQLEQQTELAFDRVEANVDDYLDWYYSLVGEYSRITTLLLGELEEYMIKKLEEILKQGDAFKEVEVALNTVLASSQSALQEYERRSRDIMGQNRIDTEDTYFHVVQRVSLEDVLNPPVHQDLINLENRLMVTGGAGAVAGLVTAVVVNKIIAKVVGKNIIKVAAKALTKVVASKAVASAGGASAGALTGATIGSVVPGVGTAAGAVVGGIIGGLVAGVTVDKLLLLLEESLNRDEFKREIIAAIKQAKIEFLAELTGECEDKTTSCASTVNSLQ